MGRLEGPGDFGTSSGLAASAGLSSTLSLSILLMVFVRYRLARIQSLMDMTVS